MNLWSAWARPEYRYRPIQILKRVVRARRRPAAASVKLPWDFRIRVSPRDDIGRHLWLRGIFDLPVTEVLWRLARPGSLAADVGANIGYMTSILAARGAIVHAFEPNPSANQQLWLNVMGWPGARVTIHSCALSDHTGRARLVIPPPEAANPGLAALGDRGLEVETRTLAEVFRRPDRLEVMKIDVEGHELEVLRGAEPLLNEHRILHVVFEEHRDVPSPVTRLLTDHGYALFSLSYDVRGLQLKPLGEPNLPLPEYESPSYLATAGPDEALARLSRDGWQSLRGRR